MRRHKITPETALKRACLQYLKLRFGERFWFVNIIGGLGIRPGTPDTLACLDGHFVAIEFKNGERGRVSPAQQQVIGEIKTAHGEAYVIRSVEECVEMFRAFSPARIK
jgi:hypothetical protein